MTAPRTGVPLGVSSRAAALDPGAQRGDVVDGAVDEAARQVLARDRGHAGADPVASTSAS